MSNATLEMAALKVVMNSDSASPLPHIRDNAITHASITYFTKL